MPRDTNELPLTGISLSCQCCYLFIIILLLFTPFVSHAQMIPMRTTIPTPYGNVTQTTYIPGPPRYYYNGPVSYRYTFNIVLKNDSAFSAKGKINFEDHKAQSLVYKSGKTRKSLFPSNTKSVSRITIDGKVLPGVPADSCWLFRTSTGKINQYSFLAEPDTPFVTAIQDGNNGVIMALTKENLLYLVGNDNARVIKLIEKEKFLKAIALFNEQ